MRNQTIDTRAALIDFLVREVVSENPDRFQLDTRYDYDAGGHQPCGLRRSGRGGSWSRYYYVSVAPEVLAPVADAWPTNNKAYGRSFTYIGPKRILKLLGAPVSSTEVKRIQRDREEEKRSARVRNLTQSARSTMGGDGIRRGLLETLEQLAADGAVTEAQVTELRVAWAAINESLPASE